MSNVKPLKKHNRDLHPVLWAEKEKAEEKLIPLMEERKIHTEEMREVQIQINALNERKNKINDEAMKDANEIAELRKTISRLARAMGATVAGS